MSDENLHPVPKRMALSLVPEHGESLSSLVLNLAWRLRESPVEVLIRLGLVDPAKRQTSDASLALGLGSDTAKWVSAVMGLTIDQVHGTTLLGHNPVLRDTALLEDMYPSSASSFWALPQYTLFCPDCLAIASKGDPDRTAWRIEWRSPWSVACLIHGALLSRMCRECGFAVGDSNRTQGRGLVTNPGLEAAHPASCRSSFSQTGRGHRAAVCGARLDNQDSEGSAPTAVLQLQQNILDVLTGTASPSSLGSEVRCAEYLRDLRLVVAMILLADESDAVVASLPHKLDEVLENYLGQRRRAIAKHELGAPKRFDEAVSPAMRPPADPSVRAALLIASEQILAAPEPPDILINLARSAHRKNKVVWQVARRRVRPSRVLTDATRQTPYQESSRPSPALMRTAAEAGILPRNVPAFLPLALFEEHFPDHDGKARRIRRAVPMMIVRSLEDTSMAKARAYLGYREHQGKTSRTVERVMVGSDLSERAEAVALALASAPPVDYQRRREYFSPEWRIPADDWDEFRSASLAARWIRANTPWEALHFWFSVTAWAEVTQGDPLSSPLRDDSLVQTRKILDTFKRRSAQQAALSRISQRIVVEIDR